MDKIIDELRWCVKENNQKVSHELVAAVLDLAKAMQLKEGEQ